MEKSKEFQTPQEGFWAGEFGNEYISRNKSDQLLASNLQLFGEVLSKTKDVNSCIEFGANVGMNLKALKLLSSELDMFAIEINKAAADGLAKWMGQKNVFHGSVLDFDIKKTWDLVVLKTVLIHINPDHLQDVYQKIYDSCGKYILIAEYYNPSPVVINYRGHDDRLFKRDFAGEMLDKYTDLELKSYGFSYHRDANFPQDDINWFLLEKTN